MKKRNEERGAVSVYLALMMAVLIPLILTMIEASRVNAIKVRMECAADLSMDSVLAEYNRELFSQYDLLFIDTAYDGGSGSVDKLLDHLDDYMSYNLKPDKGIVSVFGKDITGLRQDSAEIVRLSRATDEKGAVFRYMVMSSMLERYGLAYVSDVKDLVAVSSSADYNSSDVSGALGSAQGAVDGIVVPEPELEYDEGGNEIPWEPPKKDDPAGKANAASKGVLLMQVCDGEVSGAEADLSCYASHRSLISGDGMCEDWKPHDGLEEQLLFDEYIMEKCGNYRTQKEGSRLAYETEYIICGKNRDESNLSSIAGKLMILRGSANTIYFFGNSELQAEAKAMAAGLSFVLYMPEAEALFEILIDMAWIYAETVYDVRTLFQGGKVPLVKQAGDWHLSLENALGMAVSGEGEGGGRGQSYEDHLRMFLFMVPLEERTMRCMDIVEMDIRQVSGYEDFCLDNCVAGGTIQFIFCSSYGYSFLMERRFRYA